VRSIAMRLSFYFVGMCAALILAFGCSRSHEAQLPENERYTLGPIESFDPAGIGGRNDGKRPRTSFRHAFSRNPATQQPAVARVWIPARSLRECRFGSPSLS
jgi:hypothetical protein